MPKDRFSEFVFKVERLSKCLKKLEMMTAERLGIKEVHIFWIYALIDHPEGLTASELARINSINRSLVSREIKELEKKSIIRYRSSGSADNKYNAKIVLTEKGIEEMGTHEELMQKGGIYHSLYSMYATNQGA